jgi:hypothetical protein
VKARSVGLKGDGPTYVINTKIELTRVGTRGNETRDERNLSFNITVEPIQVLDLTSLAQWFF